MSVFKKVFSSMDQTSLINSRLFYFHVISWSARCFVMLTKRSGASFSQSIPPELTTAAAWAIKYSKVPTKVVH